MGLRASSRRVVENSARNIRQKINICLIEMFDTQDLRPVVIAMTLYIILSHLIPKILTKPTKIQVVDDVVVYSDAQRKSLVPGAIMSGMVVFLTMMVNKKM